MRETVSLCRANLVFQFYKQWVLLDGGQPRIFSWATVILLKTSVTSKRSQVNIHQLKIYLS